MPCGGSREGVLFLAANASKRSLALNLRAAEGREALLRVAARSDVFLQSLRPGLADLVSFGIKQLDLVVCERQPLHGNPIGQPLMMKASGVDRFLRVHEAGLEPHAWIGIGRGRGHAGRG